MSTNKPALIRFEGKIHLIDSDQKLAEVAEALKTATRFGFDTETRPSFRKGEFYKTALFQLATHTDAYLIRLHHVTNFDLIKDVIENKDALKVGVAIRDDLNQLKKTFKFEPAGFVELQTVAKAKGLQNMGLRGMTEEVLGSGLSKAAKITNWESPRLTEAQILYAATDAWVGLKIYEAIS